MREAYNDAFQCPRHGHEGGTGQCGTRPGGIGQAGEETDSDGEGGAEAEHLAQGIGEHPP
ncbi:MAG: hypothetical protein H8E47_14120 [Anaerolineales bacterium]|nr:hypothetical protein [Anaerolineales bacterium]